mmetsp:Transcript_2858/g.5352  ORF Transcript_2858/g.5352 Transcript_2858/m.5352 type:complete len:550 (-) Transcript_2858:3461-5110(-)
MVHLSSLWLSIYLLSTNPSNNIIRQNKGNKHHQHHSSNPIRRQNSSTTNNPSSSSIKRSDQKHKNYAGDGDQSSRNSAQVSTNKGRKRFTRQGTKKMTSTIANDKENLQQQEVQPLPPLTKPNSPRPFYYTCRHTYEDALMEEIQRYASRLGTKNDRAGISVSSPYPGLVRVAQEQNNQYNHLSEHFDPIYALQVMPQAVVVSAESIKGLAKEIMLALLGISEDGNNIDSEDLLSTLQRNDLNSACRGSLTVHTIVPGCCKGQPAPVMKYRSEKVGEELTKILRKIFPAARKAALDGEGNSNVESPSSPQSERWLLQLMLQSNNLAVASLTKCKHVGPGHQAYWPNYRMPLGLAKVDIEEKMPSSAYRKLMEALECMAIMPSSSAFVVDLGASPGGWTAVMRRLGCYVVAVDRSDIDPKLMADNCVTYVKGDAFTYSPPIPESDEGQGECWMISDVIAYPDRITELLGRWCQMDWASYLVVTMKFQGDAPALDEVDCAIDIVKRYNYDCRVKHFFNNKNEVTFMISRSKEKSRNYVPGLLGVPLYPLCS